MRRAAKISSETNSSIAGNALKARFLKSRPLPSWMLAEDLDEMPKFRDDDVYEELDVDGDSWAEDREFALQIAGR